MPFEPVELDPLEVEALPRVPADVEPALRLADDDEEEGGDAELMLLPADAELTLPAADAALLVAALTRALSSAADLLVAATPPPVPAA
ncbi:MAG: hypothetical protein JOY61_02300 [Chloroflexi bacterium]|nr:hypothetical protein [Chloroflexota bacterium]